MSKKERKLKMSKELNKWELEVLVKSWAWELALHCRWNHAGEWDKDNYVSEWMDGLDVSSVDNLWLTELYQDNYTDIYLELRKCYSKFLKLNQNKESIEIWIQNLVNFLIDKKKLKFDSVPFSVINSSGTNIKKGN